MALDGTKIVYYHALLAPVNDSDPAGGPIDRSMRVTFSQFGGAAMAKMVFTSDDPEDTRTVGLVAANDLSGTELTENVVLTGTTPKESELAYWRHLEVKATIAHPTASVSVQQGLGGTVRGTIFPGEQGYRSLYRRAISSPTVGIPRYAKIFAENTDLILPLRAPAGGSATVVLSQDNSNRLKIALENTLDGTGQISNRLQPPPGLVFVDDHVPLAIISGTLGPRATQGIWLEQLLGINDVGFWSAFVVQAQGGG